MFEEEEAAIKRAIEQLVATALVLKAVRAKIDAASGAFAQLSVTLESVEKMSPAEEPATLEYAIAPPVVDPEKRLGVLGPREDAPVGAKLSPAEDRLPLPPFSYDSLCNCGAEAERLSTWHEEPPGWTCRECGGFVPRAHVTGESGPHKEKPWQQPKNYDPGAGGPDGPVVPETGDPLGEGTPF